MGDTCGGGGGAGAAVAVPAAVLPRKLPTLGAALGAAVLVVLVATWKREFKLPWCEASCQRRAQDGQAPP